jgi:hypothetical protein
MAVTERITASSLRWAELCLCCLAGLGVAKAGVAGAQDGLGAVGNLELAKMAEMWLAWVLAASGNEVQDLAFPGGQL